MRKLLSALVYSAILVAFIPFDYHVYLEVALAGLTLLVLVWGVAWEDIRFRDFINPYTALMFILFIWSFVSIIWVADRPSWITANGIIFISLVFAVALSYLIKLQKFRHYLTYVIVGIIVLHQLVAWYDVINYMGYVTFNPVRLLENYHYYGVVTFFGNVNDFALFSLFGLIFIMAWHPTKDTIESAGEGEQSEKLSLASFRTFEAQLGRVDWLLIAFKVVVSLSCLLMIYFLNARGILFAAFYGIIFYFLLHIKHRWIRRLTIVGIGVAVVLTILVLYTDIMDALWGDGSFVIRYNLIRNGWNHLKSSNFLGVGAGNTEYYMEHFNYHYTGGYRVMHNWWMGMLVEFGVPFFLLYGLYHARVFLSAYYWSIKYDSQIGKWVATWLIGFIVAGFIPNTLFNFVWFWFIHNFVFVWFEYRASATEFEEKQANLDFGLKGQLNRLSDWLERKLVKNLSE